MQLNSVKILAFFILLNTITSCGNKKNLVYFQDSNGAEVQIDSYLVPRLEVGDIISIEITGPDHELAKPFNQPELVRPGSQLTSYVNGTPATYGYLVGPDSTVSVPIVGKIKVAGLDRNKAVETIEAEVAKFLNTPTVAIRILNFKITILGEVNRPGTFAIPNERVTIMEALGISNDLKITGERKNVLVIRVEDGIKKEYRVDLTSKKLFESPVYNLKQNDVIYVQPNRKSRYDASLLKSTGSLIISATSLILSTLILIFSIK